MKSSASSCEPLCNCDDRQDCSLDGKCFTDNIVFQVTIRANKNNIKIYIEFTKRPWKHGYYAHKTFSKRKYRNSTTLFKCIQEKNELVVLQK